MSPLGSNTTRKDYRGDQSNEGETTCMGKLLEGHDLAEDSTIQANLETAC